MIYFPISLLKLLGEMVINTHSFQNLDVLAKMAIKDQHLKLSIAEGKKIKICNSPICNN